MDVIAVAAAPAVKAIGNSDHAICGGENRRTLGTGNVCAGVGVYLAGDGVHAVTKLRGNRTRNGERPLQGACRDAGAVRVHKFSTALCKAAEQFCPQFLILRVLQELQVGVLADGKVIIQCHLVGCFVGQFDYKDGFGYLCCGCFSVFVRRFYNGGFRTSGVVHRVHRPHNFPQLVHLIFRQRRNGCALFAARHIRRKDRQDILPANVVHIIVGCNVLAVVLYCLGDFFQPVAVFCRQGFYGFAHGDGRCVGGIGGKKDAVGRAGNKRYKADDDNNAKCHADACGDSYN